MSAQRLSKWARSRRSDVRTSRMRCARCGDVSWYRPREAKCKRPVFGHGSFCCWGTLTRVEKPRPILQYREVEVKVNEHLRADYVRADAAKKLAAARKQVTEKARQLARLATSLRLWERRASYYAKRASVTDAEVTAERQARAERAARKPRRRALALGGKELQ